MLDVGCGPGYFLECARSAGWECYGVEPRKYAADKASQRGFHVFHGELVNAAYADNYFNVVAISHVLEHVLDPRALMSEITRILHPDGCLMVVIPSEVDSLIARLGKPSDWEHLPYHINYFGKNTVLHLLNLHGLIPFKVEGWFYLKNKFTKLLPGSTEFVSRVGSDYIRTIDVSSASQGLGLKQQVYRLTKEAVDRLFTKLDWVDEWTFFCCFR